MHWKLNNKKHILFFFGEVSTEKKNNKKLVQQFDKCVDAVFFPFFNWYLDQQNTLQRSSYEDVTCPSCIKLFDSLSNSCNKACFLLFKLFAAD